MNELTVTLAHVIKMASGLKSEDGENTEYDRALVELTCDLFGWSSDSRDEVAELIGIRRE